jgi:hypothetical protein
MVNVFKTSVKTIEAVSRLKPKLEKILSSALWNFDIEDCDNILRIDSQSEVSSDVIRLLKYEGFECQELDD